MGEGMTYRARQGTLNRPFALQITVIRRLYRRSAAYYPFGLFLRGMTIVII